MKKTILLTLALSLTGVNYFAQPGSGGTSGSCVNTMLSSLASCLSGNGVTFYIIDTGTELDLYGIGSPPPGQIISCLVHYNADRVSCPAAPLIVNKTSLASSKKVAR